MSLETGQHIVKRRTKGEATRHQILTSAVACVGTWGLARITIDRVAKHAGTSRALVVFYFKSKENLVSEVLDFLNDCYGSNWNRVLQRDNIPDLDKFLLLLDCDLHFACEYPQYVSAYVSYWGEDKGRTLFADQTHSEDRERNNELRSILSRILQEHGLDPKRLPVMMTAIISILWGFWIESYLDPQVDYYHKATEAIRMLLGAILPEVPLPALEDLHTPGTELKG